MAKINFGVGIADARNAVGGHVFSKNQFGAYVRQKVSPVQPRTPAQTAVRALFTNLSKRWATVLTDAERAAWLALAQANPVLDVFGNSQILTGLQLYQRVNRNLQSVGVATIDAAPADQNVNPLETLSFSAAFTGTVNHFTFTPTPLAPADNMAVFATPLLNPGRKFTKSFMRQIGSTGAAAASPFDMAALWTAKYGALAAGQRIGIMVSVVNTNNGAAAPFMFSDAIVGA